eukprot:4069811-Prymnesium_polylepis.1
MLHPLRSVPRITGYTRAVPAFRREVWRNANRERIVIEIARLTISATTDRGTRSLFAAHCARDAWRNGSVRARPFGP